MRNSLLVFLLVSWAASFGTPEGATRPQAAGSIRKNVIDGQELVYVPSGWFTMGGDEFERSRPASQVYLDSYWIGKNDVTVGQFRAFVAATGYQFKWGPPAYANGGQRVKWNDDDPMTRVGWGSARAYCKWAGGDLPTEAQWEKAARGTDGRKYPWGNEFSDQLCSCNMGVKTILGGQTGISHGLMPAGSYPNGASPYGCLDMAGNVWQYCLDWFNPYSDLSDHNPIGDKRNLYRVARGGSYLSYNAPELFQSDYRMPIAEGLAKPDYGFRVAMPLRH